MQSKNVLNNIRFTLNAFIITLIILLWFTSSAYAVNLTQEVSLTETTSWTPFHSDITISVAWGDVDGDGDLDLAVGNISSASLIYLNQNGVLETTASWSAAHGSGSVAWGDVDNDGDLDLAVGEHIYLNHNGTLATTATWSLSPNDGGVTSVAWGDVDGDGDLDLAVADQFSEARIYLNQNGVLETTASWVLDGGGHESIAWGDVDNDGDLDLAASGLGTMYSIYLNQNGILETSPSVSLPSFGRNSIAWGDVDGDGDLDLAVGTDVGAGSPNLIFINQSGVLDTTASWSSDEEDITSSVMWGDVDGDGDLDLAVGNFANNNIVGSSNRIYLNQNGILETTASWSSAETEPTNSIAWGDVDGDGDLDLAVGNGSYFGPSGNNSAKSNNLYLNQAMILTTTVSWLADEEEVTGASAWGDLDSDGDLDLAVDNHVYLNQNGNLETTASWSGASNPGYFSRTNVAWGDVDGDGDLDLAVGMQVYRNQNGTLETTAFWPSEGGGGGFVAWGDVDGDGDLDLAVGTDGSANGIAGPIPSSPNSIFLNQNGVLQSTPGWTSDERDATTSLAWGDVDGDGDLDLAVGNNGGAINGYTGGFDRVYLNYNGVLETTASWSSRNAQPTFGVAWGDLDGDSDLDLAVDAGNVALIYLNRNGILDTTTSWVGNGGGSVAWSDVDGDGDLDLAVSTSIYLNQNGVLETTSSWVGNGGGGGLAWGDVDSDGDLDLAAGGHLYTNLLFTPHKRSISIQLNSTSAPTWSDQSSDILASTNGYGLAHVRESSTIPIQFTLYDPKSKPANVRAYFSADGGGHWLPAIPTAATKISQLSTRPYTMTPDDANTHTFEWDVLASGHFGQSDNVVFRIEAYPSSKSQPNQVAGPNIYPSSATQTYPFRVRGYQVKVVSDESIGQPTPVSDAIVFRILSGQTQGAEPIGGLNLPFVSNHTGYLAGRGQIGVGDQLVALASVTQTQSFAVYHTSAAPTESGLAAKTVDSQTGLQELTVSAQNPLILFHLDVALEWDARKDVQFTAILEDNLKRASEIFYDLTNGQAALGSVRIFHDAKNLPALQDDDAAENEWQPWVDSHIRIYATNRMRPSAALGGVTSTVFTETVNSDIVYVPGQLQMGSVWNRYGETTGNLGEDWPRTLAHELGHYLLFLDDNYIGLSDDGVLIPVRSCEGAMADIYRDDYSEYHPAGTWNSGCKQTLSEKEFFRSDWETIGIHYPQLQIPSGNYNSLLAGPNTLPLAVTQIESYSIDDLSFEPAVILSDTVTVISGTVETTPTIDVPIFYLSQNGASTQVGKSARSFLLQSNWLIDLGRPNLGEVIAHGARVGDRICVLEPQENRLGCETINTGDNQLILHSVTASEWQPDIRVTPETSRTIQLMLNGVPSGLTIHARHFPKNGPADPAIVLQRSGAQYKGTFNLIHASPEGHVHVWVTNDPLDARRETIVDYSMGGSPGFSIGRGGFSIGRGGFSIGRGGFSIGRGGFSIGRGGFSIGRGGFSIGRGGFSIGRGGFSIGRGGFSIGRGAPAMSSDGQVVLFGQNIAFNTGEFYTLQSATLLPEAPSWSTVVGNGYWLSASDNAPDLSNQGDTTSSISFQYLGAEVPPGEEEFLRIYFWDGTAWRLLPTTLDPIQNFAAAPTRGPGLYALMSSIEVELYTQGWNLMAYPIQERRPVQEAMASIDGLYKTVYGYEPANAAQPWRVYSVDAPAYVNSLTHLEFGRGYWISTTQESTLYLKGASQVTASRINGSLPQPPATLYGSVLATADFVPAAEMPIKAFINGVLCGEGQTQTFEGRIVYVIHVAADTGNGCGVLGRSISIQVSDKQMATVQWNNGNLLRREFVPEGSTPLPTPTSQPATPSSNQPSPTITPTPLPANATPGSMERMYMPIVNQ